MNTADALSLFHPLVGRWFREEIGSPTPAQEKTWPAVARGEHVLVTAPTGSGKTLAAFLWSMDRLISGKWERGRTRVLYVSPLKALNNDIQRNLLAPLAGIEGLFREAGVPFPEIGVETRSGDTPQAVRRRMLRRPPEILITTPESLNLLLSSRSGRSLLDSLATVILDEVHTVVGGKRGIHLITAVDRLVPLSGEFQRIAMTATVRPAESVAEFIAGFKLERPAGGTRFIRRPVTIIRTGEAKAYDLNVVLPGDGESAASEGELWPRLVREFHRIINRNRSTLFFVRSRRGSESLAFRINAGRDSPLAYAHHGSLSRELRLEVETRLKSGGLKAIVATNSLELGIDIGALDEVVLVQSPPSVASAVQRVGRAGHRVGAVSRGTFFPTHGQDIVESAVIVRAMREGDIEETRPLENALDVLAQVLLSMLGSEVWNVDALYDRVRTSWPYRNLGRGQFDLVLQMLAGRYAHTRIRELSPKVSVDRIDNTASARPGVLLSLFLSGGTIPDRGYYHLRHEETGALVGELDEEFVWEATPGQNFAFGTQYWTIRRITHNEVFALPVRITSAEAPFWKAEAVNRNAHLSDKIGAFMDEADRKLDDPVWLAAFPKEYGLDRGAAENLVGYLRSQKLETRAPLPGLCRMVVEHVRTGPDGYPGNQIILHTLWGGKVNRPFALALDAAWEERHGYRLEVYAGDDSIVLQLPHSASADEIVGLVSEGNLEGLLRKRLESSGVFGARFRENAGRALLLTRRRANERLPLWLSRLRSQKLLQAALGLPDFPILLETWRTCLHDEFDLEALQRKLAGLASGSISLSECVTERPSPLARNMTWSQLNRYMYAGDELPSDRRSRLRGELLREVVFSPGLRPAVSADTVRRFEEKRQRVSPGYAPAAGRDLVDWVKERLILPWPEWQRLLASVARDAALEGDAGEEPEAKSPPAPAKMGEPAALADRQLPPESASRIVRLTAGFFPGPLVCSLERLPEVLSSFWPGLDPRVTDPAGGPAHPALKESAFKAWRPPDEDPEARLASLLGEWLQAYGPVSAADIGRTLGLDPSRLDAALEDLRDSGAVIQGALIKGLDSSLVCDAENYEILLRLERAALAPSFEPRDIGFLPRFLARVQGVVPEPGTVPAGAEEKTYRAVEQLVGFPLPAHLWEADILPARVPNYSTAHLDFALGQSDLRWQGNGRKEVRFLFEKDVDLLRPEEESVSEDDAEPGETAAVPPAAALFSDPHARYDFGTLLEREGGVGSLERKLWDGVWAGRLTNDTWSALRRGLQVSFHVGDAIARQKRGLEFASRGESLRLSAWRESQAYPGSWLLLPPPSAPGSEDMVEQEEIRKDRVRLLLDRYGILFKKVLARETSPFRWPEVFRTLRLMELSGETLSGYFFKGIAGPQFMSHPAFRLFLSGLAGDEVFWLSAVDPASPCGLALEGLRGSLPKRVEGTHLVYRGSRLVLISQRNGRSLDFRVAPDDDGIPAYLAVFHHLLGRGYVPLRRVVIETVNGGAAPESPYLPAFKEHFEVVVDVKRVSLFRRLEL